MKREFKTEIKNIQRTDTASLLMNRIFLRKRKLKNDDWMIIKILEYRFLYEKGMIEKSVLDAVEDKYANEIFNKISVRDEVNELENKLKNL